jgi:hypothetical protein
MLDKNSGSEREFPVSELVVSATDETRPFGHADEWVAFMQHELDASVAAYVAKPALLGRDFNDERQVRDDYAGRELLELVQNAADAAAEMGGNGRVLIDVKRSGLFVANSGQPFRPSGVSSLMTAHLSDKPQRKRSLIGAKGLGFRAILNWSREPLISSGALELAFSRTHSEEAVKELGAKHANVAKFLAGRRPQPAPILPFPLFGPAIRVMQGTEHGAELVSQVRQLRGAGYDTVIASPFFSEKAFNHAKQQTAEFEPRFLLFVRALSEIEIRVEGFETRIWKKVISGVDAVELQFSTGDVTETETWICRYADGELKDDAERPADQPSRYELAVALRTDAENERGELHCYFPTSVAVPFCALFHATLEVSSNRKSLKDQSSQNDEVLSRLAVFYAETLSELRQAGAVLNALEFLYPDETFPEALKRFEKLVYEAAALEPIIETIGGDHVCADQTRLGPAGYDKFFPDRLFPDLAHCAATTDHGVLRALGVQSMAPEEAIDILRKAHLDLDERALVIAGIALNLPGKFHHRSFLIDGKDRPLKASNSCFPPPTSGRPPVLPRWARGKFLSGPLWDRLSGALPGTPREKILRLKSFGVEEYNLDGVVRSLVRQAERLIDRSPAEVGARVRGELLSALARLHDREGESVPKFPPLSVLARAKDGEWRPLRELHLSNDYGLAGRINEAIYTSRPDLLLAPVAEQRLSDTPVDAAAFFEWMAAHRWPKVEEVTDRAPLWQAILSILPTEFEVFDDRGTPQAINKSDLSLGYSARFKTESIVGLDDILESADSDAIIAWLARDPRFDAATGFPFGCSLEARKNAIANFRTYRGDLADFVRLQIRSTAWLECVDGERRAPSEAMRDPGRLVGLFVRPRAPKDEIAEALSLDHTLWARGLANASVPATLQDLSEAEIYGLLHGLEGRGCEPDLVRRFYLHILELEDFRAERGGASGELFRHAGTIQARRGRVVEWLSPSAVFYVDRDGIPASVREHLPLIDLPTRRGAKQVSERFGVQPLGRQDFSIEIAAHVAAPEPDRSLLVHRFAECKKFVRALRSAASSDTTSLRRLDRLVLIPATEVSLTVSLQDQEFGGALEPWSHLLDSDALYVTIEQAMEPGKLLQLSASAVGDGLAELFEIQSGADFATMFAMGDDASRRIMFRKFLPNFSEEELEALFGDIDDPGTLAPPRFDPSRLGVPPAQSKQGLAEEPEADEPSPAASAAPNPDSVDAHAMDQDTSSPRASRKTGLRVSRGSGSLGRGPRDPSKTGDAETWAALFEKQQDRYPLEVAHLQGEDAFGCDLLTFVSIADREHFEETLDEDVVHRFIEVKSGGVRLTANEVKAAERYADRYFVYRVMFDGEGREAATLTAVSNPLSRLAALATELTVDLNVINEREVFKITRSHTVGADDCDEPLPAAEETEA